MPTSSPSVAPTVTCTPLGISPKLPCNSGRRIPSTWLLFRHRSRSTSISTPMSIPSLEVEGLRSLSRRPCRSRAPTGRVWVCSLSTRRRERPWRPPIARRWLWKSTSPGTVKAGTLQFPTWASTSTVCVLWLPSPWEIMTYLSKQSWGFWVDYDAKVGALQVRTHKVNVNQTPSKSKSALAISYSSLDLPSAVNEFSYVGFSARVPELTHGAYRLYDWKFSTTWVLGTKLH